MRAPPLFKLFILFAIMPIVEIALLLEVGDVIGGWNTVIVVIITAFIGASLVKQQGLQTLITAQQKMQTGNIPSQEMAEGLLLLVAGVLLVTPGFVTDGIGLLFSMPLTRPLIAKYLAKQVLSKVKIHGQFSAGGQSAQYDHYQQTSEQHFRNTSAQWQSQRAKTGESDSDNIIDGEFTDKTIDPNTKSIPSADTSKENDPHTPA